MVKDTTDTQAIKGGNGTRRRVVPPHHRRINLTQKMLPTLPIRSLSTTNTTTKQSEWFLLVCLLLFDFFGFFCWSMVAHVTLLHITTSGPLVWSCTYMGAWRPTSHCPFSLARLGHRCVTTMASSGAWWPTSRCLRTRSLVLFHNPLWSMAAHVALLLFLILAKTM